jgi:hypothetical protein
VEVLVLKVDPRTHYRDEFCENIEGQMRNRSELSGWTVYRMQTDTFELDSTTLSNDMFDILDSNGKHKLILFENELTLLDSPELLVAYISGNARRVSLLDKIGKRIAIIGAFGLLLLPFVSFFVLFNHELQMAVVFIEFVSFLLLVFLLIQWMNGTLLKSDIATARIDPSFREALKRLAVLSEREPFEETKRYIDRFQAVENSFDSLNEKER